MNLPSNKDLEMQFIGQSIVDGVIASRELTTNEFYNSNYRAAWSAICELDEENKEIEVFGIHRIGKQNGLSLTVSELANTTHGLIRNGLNGVHAKELKNLALRRQLIREFSLAAAELETKSDLSEVLENIDGKLRDIRLGLGGNYGFVPLSEIIDKKVKPALIDLQHGRTAKISTGFDELDKVIGGGFVPGDVVLIVADTGNGKSALALQLADKIATAGSAVAFASGEMRDLENGLRLLSQNARVTNLNSVVRISESDVKFLNEWADHIKPRPIHFDHTSGDIKTLRKTLKLLIAKNDVKVVMIDYIQLYKLSPNDKLGRVERLTELSQEVKRLANEFDVCIVEVAQFNREGMKSSKPSMHDLEGSGQFEKDTSLIFIIDRLENDAIEIRIEKGRNAGKTKIPGLFIGKELRFEL